MTLAIWSRQAHFCSNRLEIPEAGTENKSWIHFNFSTGSSNRMFLMIVGPLMLFLLSGWQQSGLAADADSLFRAQTPNDSSQAFPLFFQENQGPSRENPLYSARSISGQQYQNPQNQAPGNSIYSYGTVTNSNTGYPDGVQYWELPGSIPDNYIASHRPAVDPRSQAATEYQGMFAGNTDYLAMGNRRRKFSRSSAIPLEPRYPSYDHWSDMSEQPWNVQLLPDTLIYPSYLAGMKEPRLATMWVKDDNFDWIWDATLGGRVGVIRFGTNDPVLPEGIQLDMEGAVSLRLDIMHERDMMANDFRCGFPLTFGNKRWQYKFGYYHLSSHMGDEYMLRTGEPRINYVRDSIVFGVARRFYRDWRAYAETAWAFFTGEETRPWEFQFGVEYSPIAPARGFCGTPFFAINAHVFQEKNYNGYLCVQTGWQWRGRSNHLFRIGLQYLNGHDDLFVYHNRVTNKIGFGIWYDF